MRQKPRQRGISTVTVHAILAGLALLIAYMTWTRDRTQVQGDTVTVLDLNKRDINSLVYEDDNRTVTVERRSGTDGEPYAWVTVKSRQKTLETNPAMPPSPHGSAPPMPGAASPAGAPKPPASAPPAAGKPGTPPPAPVVAPIKPAANKGGDKAAADKDNPAATPPGTAPPASASAGAAVKGPSVAVPAPGTLPKVITPVRPGSVASAVAGSGAASPGTAPPGAASPGAAPPAASGASQPPVHEIKETIVVRPFRGSEQADKLFDSFAPLRALRSLGQVDDNKAKELGFTDSKKSLTITAKGQTYKFKLGNASYGGGDFYARDAQGQVHLLPQRIISDFEFAESRLMERRLHRFERGDFDRVEVTVNGKTRVLLQQKRQDQVNFYFVDKNTPDKRDDTLRNWIDKVMRLAISDYVAQGEEPQAASQAPMSGAPAVGDIVSMRFFEGNKEIGNAVLSRYPAKNGQNEFYARTETTIGMVKLLQATAENAIQDAEKW